MEENDQNNNEINGTSTQIKRDLYNNVGKTIKDISIENKRKVLNILRKELGI
jgi:hypothetical protein